MFKYLTSALRVSVVVFSVTVILCMGNVFSNGTPLFALLNAGIVGLIACGALRGSILRVSKPLRAPFNVELVEDLIWLAQKQLRFERLSRMLLLYNNHVPLNTKKDIIFSRTYRRYDQKPSGLFI